MKSALILLSLALIASAAVQSDLVTGLTEQTGYKLPWYSGYLNIDTKTAKMNSHYFFFPSQSGNESDPVLLWLNGGPGCSSLLGAAQEHGPWVFEENSKNIKLNSYSWNKNAHVLYLESPPGVGYSTTTDYKWNDAKTAEANLHSVLKFFELYSEYKKNKFYISGESYAGIYVPTLANSILKHNQQASKSQNIKLKGILVGNGCTDPLECSFNASVNPFMYQTYAAQGWFTLQQQAKFEKACGSYTNPDLKKLQSLGCTLTGMPQLSQANGVNMYNIIGTCWHQDIPEIKGQMDFIQQEAFNTYQNIKNGNKSEEPISRLLAESEETNGLPPCVDGIGPMTFFNNDEVKEALHVPKSIKWEMCNDKITQSYDRSTIGSYHIYPTLIQAGLRVWIYSGDVDAAVPTGGTLFWIGKLKEEFQYKDIVPQRAWYTEGVEFGYQEGNRQNAGQYWKTEGLTLVTFKGCGHMVPQDNHVGAYDMIQAFFNGEDLPAF